jgi:hypothetical protein
VTATTETITQNSIYNNTGKGIKLAVGGNHEIVAPQIVSADKNEVTGLTRILGFATDEAGGTLEVFKAEVDQGKTYLGSASIFWTGSWEALVSGLVSGDAVVTTGTSPTWETSEFSAPHSVISTVFTTYQIDNMIATLESGADYIGENVFNTDGTNQTRTGSIETGGSKAFYIKIKNSGTIPDVVIVTGTASSGVWDVTYYDAKTGGNNITSSILGSGWSTGVLASTASKEIRAVIENSGTTTSTFTALITSESILDNSKKDAVKAVITVAPSPAVLDHFDVTAPSTAIKDTTFSTIIMAKDSGGNTIDVSGITQLSVDSGTISPESIAASEFTNGIWLGDVSLSNLGQRTIIVTNGTATGAAIVIVYNDEMELSTSDLGVDGMSMTFPAGAASEEITVSVVEITAPPADPPPGFYIGGIIVDINVTPSDFLLPVTVTIPIDGPLADPRVYYFDGTDWSSDGITVIEVTDTYITFTTTHFSIFTSMAALDSNLVRFGPNPYNPNVDGNARIWYWLPSDKDTSIYIIDLSGTLVWKQTYIAGTNGGQSGENNVEFDGKTAWGNVLGNGVYLYKIVQDGKSVGGGKIAIIK